MTLVIVGHLGEATPPRRHERRGADSTSVLDRPRPAEPTHRPGRQRTTQRLPAHHPRPDPVGHSTLGASRPGAASRKPPPISQPACPVRCPPTRPGRRPRFVATSGVEHGLVLSTKAAVVPAPPRQRSLGLKKFQPFCPSAAGSATCPWTRLGRGQHRRWRPSVLRLPRQPAGPAGRARDSAQGACATRGR